MSKYWRKREKEHMRKRERDTKVIARRLRESQERVLADVEMRINSFYGKYATSEGITIAEARKRADKVDINRYKKREKSAYKDLNELAQQDLKLFNLTTRISRLELLKADLRLSLLKGSTAQDKIMQQNTLRYAKSEYKHQGGQMAQLATYNAGQLDKVVNASFHSATWSDRIWNNQQALITEIERHVENNLVQGRGARKYVSEIRKSFDVSYYEAERLMRTEMARVHTDVFIDSMEQNGYSKYEFIAEPTACKICSGLDGEVFELKDASIGDNMPPIHPNCMCATTSVYED